METKPTYLLHSVLRKRWGWNRGTIKKFMPQACKEVVTEALPEPRHLYSLGRIENIEATQEWQQQAAFVEAQRTSDKSFSGNRERSSVEFVKGLQITIADYEYEQLVRQACTERNRLEKARANRLNRPIVHWLHPGVGMVILNPILLNFIRHNTPAYKQGMLFIEGKEDQESAYVYLKQRVNNAILEKYPDLKSQQREP